MGVYCWPEPALAPAWERVVDICCICGGEIYPGDPVEYDEANRPICPCCFRELEEEA